MATENTDIRRTGRTIIKMSALVALLLVVMIAVVAVLMYMRIVPVPGPLLSLLAGTDPPEYSARYYPGDTAVYGWFTLAPGGGQLNNMLDIFDRLNEFRTFEDWWDDLQADFEEETGIDVENDVQPWIGPDASIGLMEYDDSLGTFEVAMTIGVRDHEAAEDFMDDWLEYLESSEGADFEDDSYEGFDIWVADDDDLAFGLSPKLLVFANTEDALEELIDNISEDTGRSLADNTDFQEARAALRGQRFASVYLDARQAFDVAEITTGTGPFGQSILDYSPDWIMISAGWFERGMVMEITAPAVDDLNVTAGDLSDPGRLLPDDTLAFLAASFDPDLEQWRDQLEQYDLESVLPYPGMINKINYELTEVALYQLGSDAIPQLDPGDDFSDVLDLGLWFAEELTRIDFEAEFADYLTGEAILAVGDFDFANIESGSVDDAVNAVALLSYHDDGEEDLSDTMDDMADFVEEYLFVKGDAVDVGADNDAVVFPIPDTGYEPGYVLHDGYLTFGSTEEALEDVVEQQNGDGTALSSMPEYQRALSNLPGNSHFLGYFDLQRIFERLADTGTVPTTDEYQLLEETLGTVALSATSDPGHYRAAVAVTLFPE